MKPITLYIGYYKLPRLLKILYFKMFLILQVKLFTSQVIYLLICQARCGANNPLNSPIRDLSITDITNKKVSEGTCKVQLNQVATFNGLPENVNFKMTKLQDFVTLDSISKLAMFQSLVLFVRHTRYIHTMAKIRINDTIITQHSTCYSKLILRSHILELFHMGSCLREVLIVATGHGLFSCRKRFMSFEKRLKY